MKYSNYRKNLTFIIYLQTNGVTHYMDLSFIYGSSEDAARSLRTFKGGRLNTSTIDDKPFPPTGQAPVCLVDKFNKLCFLAYNKLNNNSLYIICI